MGRVSRIQAGRYNPPTDIPFYAERLKLERLYNLRRADRLMVEGCMRVESNGGRGYLDPAPSTVGASEVRASLRPRVRPNRDETGDALKDSASLDRRGVGTYRRATLPLWVVAGFSASDAMRIAEHAGRVVIVEPAPRETRKVARVATPASDAAATYQARLDALGADLSLIDG